MIQIRLFIAINFSQEVKAHLAKMIQELKKQSVQGNFTRIENMHLTLAFLGEVDAERVPEIKRAMEQTVIGKESFDMVLQGLGKFMNRGEALYWCGIKEQEELTRLQETLIKNLKMKQFAVDEKTFVPHITLSRRCIMNQNFEDTAFSNKISQISMRVESISLMESVQKQGQVTYTSLGDVELSKE